MFHRSATTVPTTHKCRSIDDRQATLGLFSVEPYPAVAFFSLLRQHQQFKYTYTRNWNSCHSGYYNTRRRNHYFILCRQLHIKMSNKKTRGAAKCKEKSLKPDDFTIEFNANGIAIGENAAKFMSWIGVECRKKIPYNKLANQVGSKLYDEIWEYAKQSWKIPNDHGKQVTLSKAKIIMRNFRRLLRDEYVKKNITPFKDFDYLDKKLWGSFVAYAKLEEFKEISQKATASAKKNVDHAHVGRCGFAGLEPKVTERWNQLVISYPHLALIEDDRSKLYTVSRSVLNRVTNLYEIGPDKQSEGELKGTLKDLMIVNL
ncbi:hypothetical protein QVD17_31453 [Tagetes erecta]|uniref:Uncharacterized protein n=1 Tax=Tagetes erecta TaxID=13708 RepID=A0AAD8NPC0_TARER|nr:hypothetical protein QVD17_31453 [Tagetes erecta]